MDREKFIADNIKLVNFVINKIVKYDNYKYLTEDEEDIYQIGCIGLVKAVDKFDFEAGVCIRNELMNHLKVISEGKVSFIKSLRSTSEPLYFKETEIATLNDCVKDPDSEKDMSHIEDLSGLNRLNDLIIKTINKNNRRVRSEKIIKLYEAVKYERYILGRTIVLREIRDKYFNGYSRQYIGELNVKLRNAVNEAYREYLNSDCN